MPKIYISLMETTAALEAPLADALAGYELMVNKETRTTPVNGGESKMEAANRWPADLYIAAKTGGVEGLKIVAAGKNQISKSWTISKLAMTKLQELDPYAVYGVAGSGEETLAEIADTNMTSLYIIIGSAKDAAAMEWMGDNLNGIAEAIAITANAYFDEFPPIGGPDEPTTDAPSTPDTPAETDTEEWPQPITGDAALGYAIRTVFAAFWEAQNGRD